MNLKTIGIIIRREYLNKVKKKSFLLTTLLVPILAGGGMIAMMAVMMSTKEKLKKVAVVDRSGIVMPALMDTETIDFVDYSEFGLDSVKTNLEGFGLDAVLSISTLDTAGRSISADITSINPLGVEMVDVIDGKVNAAVEAYRVESYGIEGLGQIMEDIRSDIDVRAFTMDKEGRETVSETGVYAVISMLLGIIIFLFVTLYGSMVMSAVIEEKSSRVVEVLISSVRPVDLMFGKIIGIALVALTQFLLWIVLTLAIVGAAGGAMGEKLGTVSDPAQLSQIAGVDASQMEDMASMASGSPELSVVMTTIMNMPLGSMAVAFVFFFLFGYMLYASLFAAVGSAVDNEGDTQQLQLPLTIPLMIAYIIAIYTFKAPDSSIAFWGSLIPFTSPIVMIARLPFGVPAWELIVSFLALIFTFMVCAWCSAKIYKVGILMFGKKSSWRDLWNWLKQS